MREGSESTVSSSVRNDDSLAPTLGPQVANFINTFGIHGPGDRKGEPFQLSMEELAFLYEAYEYEEDAYRPGRLRRRYRRGIYCRRKGLRKSELMALVALAEFDGPVRFSHFAEEDGVDEWGWEYAKGDPVGVRVTSPEIPVVATTEEQAERLVWGVMRYIFGNCPLAKRYKIQTEEIFFAGQDKEGGWCYLLPPTNSEAADGAKPTFIPREEAHLWTSKPLRDTAQTMDRNAAKRLAADPWTMDATTAYAPGEGSVLEAAIKSIDSGVESILLDQRQASRHWDLFDDEQWLEAVKEASGDAWEWTPVSNIRDLWLDPEVSEASFRRFQLNQAEAVEDKPFSGDRFDVFVDPKRTPAPSKRTPILLFLDGALTRDSTVLVGITVEDRPHIFLVDAWERPDAGLRSDWHVPRREVIERVAEMQEEFTVVLLGGDSDRYWSPQLIAWEDEYGEDRVVHFPTRMGKLMGNAIDNFEEEWRASLAKASEGGETTFTFDGDDLLRRHFANTVLAKRPSSPYRVMAKASEGTDDKIDGAVASVSGYALLPAARAMSEGLMRPKRVGVF